MSLNTTFRATLQENTLRASSRLSFTPRRSEFGDSRDDAKDVGTLKSGKSYNFSGDVGGKDLDFFKVKLGKRTSFSVKLKNDSDGNQPIAISILNTSGQTVKGSNGKFLFSNIKAGKKFTLTEPKLAAGTYFVRVQSADGKDEDYDIKLFTGSSSDDGSSLDNAKNLGSINLGQTKSGFGSVGTDDTDLYKFSIGDTSRVLTRITNDSFDQPIALTILDRQGKAVKKSNGGLLFANVEEDDTATLLAPTLEAGTYYLRFTSAEGNGEDYSFSIKRSGSTNPI